MFHYSTIQQLIATRRMIYLQTILKRPKGELIRKIYKAMKEDPLPGDWCELILSDFNKLNIHISDNLIQNMNEDEYKNLIKDKVREAAFNEFKHMQAGHQKGNTLYHEDLKHPQPYLITNKLSNSQVSLLFNLRTQCVRGIKDNFHGQNNHNLKCDLCKNETDNQDHLLKCHVLKQHIQWNHEDVKHEHIYGTLQQQIDVTILLSTLLEVRDRLLEEDNKSA